MDEEHSHVANFGFDKIEDLSKRLAIAEEKIATLEVQVQELLSNKA